MSTPITDLIPMFSREIDIPGTGPVVTSAAAKLGYIEDGFWDIRLAGMLKGFTVELGENLTPPGDTGTKYFTDQESLSEDLDQKFWMMITLFAGFRLLRLKVMQLAVNFTAEAGPVSFEQQASATVLRALLESLERRIAELKELYSDLIPANVFVVMDGLAQSEYATLNSLPDLQVLH